MKVLNFFKKHTFLRYVSYGVPGAVILFFGMFALYSTIMLIDAQKSFVENTSAFNKNSLELHEGFYDFSNSFHHFINGDLTVTSSVVINKFAILYDLNKKFSDKIKSLNRHFVFTKKLDEIEQKIKSLAPHVVDLRSSELQPEKEKLYNLVSLKTQDIEYDLSSLQKQYPSIVNEMTNLAEMETREIRLYWSVIAMGLCGFILVLLNADKLRQLRKNNEEKINYLGLLENRLTALEAAHDGIIIIDENDNVTFINTAMCKMLDVENSEQKSIVSRKWTSLFAEDEIEILEEDVLPELRENGYWMGELPLYHSNGSVVYTDFSMTQLSGGGMIVTVMDVTEKQRAESEKKQFEEQFYQAQKMEAVGRLAGGIAHDFNNILAAINGYSEFLVEDLDPTTEQHKFATNIIQAVRQAKDLVDQILAFSRRKDSALTTIDFLGSVHEAESMLLASCPKTLELKTEITISKAVITGNATQISQVLMNLCVNACDAMEDDHGILTIGVSSYRAQAQTFCISEAIKSDFPDPKGLPFLRIYDVGPAQTRLIVGHLKENQDYIKLSIGDTGTGMSRVVMEHVFEPFFTTKPVDKGTGLGLATVHGVIIGHSGALVIDSTIGKGTTFDLYFPAVEIELTAQNASVELTQQILNPQSLRILLVEDQSYVLDMMHKMLTRSGHKVTCAGDGTEALFYLRRQGHEIDLVITDQNMPKMTGIEMIEQIHIERPNLDFLVISGYSEKQMQDMIERHPAIKGMLRKPVSNAEIQEKIAQIILQKSSQNYKKLAS